jgi:hypothetical protein
MVATTTNLTADDLARPTAGTKTNFTADYADTRGCAGSPRPFLSAHIRDIRGSLLYLFSKLKICAARNERLVVQWKM